MIRILGAGGFAREVALHLKTLQDEDAWCIDSRQADPADDLWYTLIGIGDPAVREAIDKAFPLAHWYRLHPPHPLGWENRLGEGTIICPGSQWTVGITLGRHVILNLNVTVGHDTIIGDYTTVSPGAHISGSTLIGKRCYIGTGAALRERLIICDDVVIGAGGVVVKDILEPGTYVGNPVRRIK